MAFICAVNFKWFSPKSSNFYLCTGQLCVPFGKPKWVSSNLWFWIDLKTDDTQEFLTQAIICGHIHKNRISPIICQLDKQGKNKLNRLVSKIFVHLEFLNKCIWINKNGLLAEPKLSIGLHV